MAEEFTYQQKLTPYEITPERREFLLSRGSECAVVWTTAEGWPVGVMHNYIWKDGRFWVQCTTGRSRVAAMSARPHTSIIFAADDQQTITAKTIAHLHRAGTPHGKWFFEAIGRLCLPLQMGVSEITQEHIDTFIKQTDTPDRVIIEFEPVKWITFDGRKVKAHLNGRWSPDQPWSEGIVYKGAM